MSCSSEPWKCVCVTSCKRGYMWCCVHVSTSIMCLCSNHDRKRTCVFGCVSCLCLWLQNQCVETLMSKRRCQNALHVCVLFYASLVSLRRFREHALRIVRGYCSSKIDLERRFIWRHLNVVICACCVHASTRISVLLDTTIVNATLLGVLNQRFETTFIRK